MSIADEVRQLEDENAELKSQNEYYKTVLVDQNSKYRAHLARRDQQLQDAAASLDAAEVKIAEKDARIEILVEEVSRFRLARDMMDEARHGRSPLDERRSLVRVESMN